MPVRGAVREGTRCSALQVVHADEHTSLQQYVRSPCPHPQCSLLLPLIAAVYYNPCSWSRPSSGSDSDGFDGEQLGPGQEQQPGGARSGVSGNTRSGKGANKRGSGAGSGVRKSRRQRNAEQMEMNRVAQQKYRCACRTTRLPQRSSACWRLLSHDTPFEHHKH